MNVLAAYLSLIAGLWSDEVFDDVASCPLLLQAAQLYQ